GVPLRIIGAVVDINEHKLVENRLVQRARQQAVVAELGHQALAGVEPQDLMEEAVYQVVQVLGVEYCKVLELLPAGEELLLKAGSGWREGLVGSAVVGAALGSQARYTLMTRGPVVVTHLRTEQRFSG